MNDIPPYVPAVVPVFPLPGVVLFPHMIVPLHIFEPRYREMMADALDGERVLALALLKPGFEPLYHTLRAPIHETLGVGRIVEFERVKGGDYNLLLQGIGRAVILEERNEDRPYRLARVEPLETYCSTADVAADQVRRDLLRVIRGNPAIEPSLRRSWLRLAGLALGLDQLTDCLSAGLPVDAELRQCLLNEPDALLRARLLLEQIRTLTARHCNMQRAARSGDHNLN